MAEINFGDVIRAIYDKADSGLDDDDIEEIYEILVDDDKLEDLIDKIPEDVLIDYMINNFDITAILEAFADQFNERALAENIVNLGDEMIETMKDVIEETESKKNKKEGE